MTNGPNSFPFPLHVFVFAGTSFCQNVSSKPNEVTTKNVFYEQVNITLLSIGSKLCAAWLNRSFEVYFKSCNFTKARKTPVAQLPLVDVLQCFHSHFMGFGGAFRVLGVPAAMLWSSGEHAGNMLRHSWHLRFWQHCDKSENQSACDAETTASRLLPLAGLRSTVSFCCKLNSPQTGPNWIPMIQFHPVCLSWCLVSPSTQNIQLIIINQFYIITVYISRYV